MNPALKVSVAALAAAFVMAHLSFQSAPQPGPAERCALEPDERAQALAARIDAKIAITRDLVDGRMTLHAAVARFRELDSSWPARDNALARLRFPGAGPDELALCDVGNLLRDFLELGTPAEWVEWSQRWEREWPGCSQFLAEPIFGTGELIRLDPGRPLR